MQPSPNPMPVLRVRALPASLDCHGRPRAGWLMEQIDVAGSAEAERIARGPVAVVEVNTFQFRSPVSLGAMVEIYAEQLRVGKKSLTLKIFVQSQHEGEAPVFVTEVIMTYVALDSQGKSRLLTDK